MKLPKKYAGATAGPLTAYEGGDPEHPGFPGCGFVATADGLRIVGRFPRHADAVLATDAPRLAAALVEARHALLIYRDARTMDEVVTARAIGADVLESTREWEV